MQALAIMYHDVVENGDFESSGFPGEGAHVYKLRREDFERHLDAIAAATAAVSTVRMLGAPRAAHLRRWRREFPSPHRGPAGAPRLAGPFLHHHGPHRHARVSDRSAIARTAPARAHHRQPLLLASHAHGGVDPRRAGPRMAAEHRPPLRVLGDAVKVASVPGRLLLARGGGIGRGGRDRSTCSRRSPRHGLSAERLPCARAATW